MHRVTCHNRKYQDFLFGSGREWRSKRSTNQRLAIDNSVSPPVLRSVPRFAPMNFFNLLDFENVYARLYLALARSIQEAPSRTARSRSRLYGMTCRISRTWIYDLYTTQSPCGQDQH